MPSRFLQLRVASILPGAHRDSVVVRAEMARVYRMLAELRTGLPAQTANSAL